MTKQDLSVFIKGQRVVPPIDFKELERIHREWERYDLDGRYKVTPNDPKGPKLKFKHGGTITMRSSGDLEKELEPLDNVISVCIKGPKSLRPTLSILDEEVA